MRASRLFVILTLGAVLFSSWSGAPAVAGIADLEAQVRSFTLPNGLTFLVLERHDAPVFSARTYVSAGCVDVTAGTTGLAHMFEHMAFKGTETIGTKDFVAEKKSMDATDAAWLDLAGELHKGEAADSGRIKSLQAAFARAQEDEDGYVLPDEFSKLLEDNGSPDVNAFTSMDQTEYICSLPSNRLEFWARMEGDRLTQPVLRQFYKERSVVQEERRLDESSPSGRLELDFWESAFLAHPYGYGVLGFLSDLKEITRQDAADFFRKHYVAKNITVALVGDVKFEEIKTLAAKYFSGVSDAPLPPPLRTVEPIHQAEIRVTVEEDAQPIVSVGYLIPGISSPDWPACELLAGILGSGRSSRLYERLVKKDRIAADLSTFAGFPANKYPNILVTTTSVAKDADPAAVETAIYAEIDRLVHSGPTPAELDKVRSQIKTDLLQSLRSNQGLAGKLAEYQGLEGDWHKLFRYMDRLEAVKAADVQRVAKEAFRQGNRIVGVLKRPVS